MIHYYEWNALIADRLARAGRPSLRVRLQDLLTDPAAGSALSSFLEMELVLPDEVANRKDAEKKAQAAAGYDEDVALALMKAAAGKFGSFGYPL